MACVPFVLAVVAPAQQVEYVEAGTHEAAARIADSILKNGKAQEYAQALADDIGPRLTGSKAYDAAVHWATAQFRALGVEVHTERFQRKGSSRFSLTRNCKQKGRL